MKTPNKPINKSSTESSFKLQNIVGKFASKHNRSYIIISDAKCSGFCCCFLVQFYLAKSVHSSETHRLKVGGIMIVGNTMPISVLKHTVSIWPTKVDKFASCRSRSSIGRGLWVVFAQSQQWTLMLLVFAHDSTFFLWSQAPSFMHKTRATCVSWICAWHRDWPRDKVCQVSRRVSNRVDNIELTLCSPFSNKLQPLWPRSTNNAMGSRRWTSALATIREDVPPSRCENLSAPSPVTAMFARGTVNSAPRRTLRKGKSTWNTRRAWTRLKRKLEAVCATWPWPLTRQWTAMWRSVSQRFAVPSDECANAPTTLSRASVARKGPSTWTKWSSPWWALDCPRLFAETLIRPARSAHPFCRHQAPSPPTLDPTRSCLVCWTLIRHFKPRPRTVEYPHFWFRDYSSSSSKY